MADLRLRHEAELQQARAEHEARPLRRNTRERNRFLHFSCLQAELKRLTEASAASAELEVCVTSFSLQRRCICDVQAELRRIIEQQKVLT